METELESQFFDFLDKSKKVLLALPENLDADSLASALALRLILLKRQKQVSVVSAGLVPPQLNFLPGAGEVRLKPESGNSLVLTLDTSVKPLEEISYQTAGQKVSIYLKPKADNFTPQDITFSAEKTACDLIIVLGARSLEDLGGLYENNTDLFFETPKINLDHKPDNEYFGQLNLVDVTATSVAEILAELFAKYPAENWDADIATCLLCGIIAGTHSFQDVQTTPKAFLKASQLIALGARQQEIIKNFYKTKSLPLLKLWGRALARIKTQEEKQLLYALLSTNDFERSQATAADLPAVLKEFLDNLSGYKLVALLAEPQAGQGRLLLAAHRQVPLESLEAAFAGQVSESGATGYRFIERDFSGGLEAFESQFLDAIKNLRL